MAMNPKDFTVEAAKSYLEKEYPFVNIYENLTETDKINIEKLANAAREKIKNPSSKVWDSMVKGQAIIGGDKFPLSPENTKALGRAVEDDVYRKVAKESVGKAGMVSGIKAREKMLASGKLVGQEAIAAKNFIADTEKYLFPEKLRAPSVKELTQVSGGMNTLGKVIGPAIAVAQGATVAQGIMDKMKAGESFKEAANNPELVKDAARGTLGYLGADVGALAGSMVPGGLPVKIGSEITGAVIGGYAGTKLADLLTGNPVVDKIIRAKYEKARNERMAKTKPTAASSVELRPGE